MVIEPVMPGDFQSGGGSQRSLSKNSAWAVAGNIMAAGGRFLIVVVLVKFLPSEKVGQALLGLAIVTPLSYLINMELRLVLVTETKEQISVGHYLTTRLVSNVILAIFLLVLCAIQRERWGWEKNAIILLVGAIRAAESWTNIYLAVLQKHERMKYVAISGGLKVTLVLAWAAAMSLLTKQIHLVLLGWPGAVLLVGWFFDRRFASHFSDVRPHWDKSAFSRLVRLGFPLGIFVAVAILNQSVAQYFISGMLSDSAVAYFGCLGSFVIGAQAIQNGVNQSVLPRLARYFVQTRAEFWKLLGKVLALSWLVMGIGLILVWYQGELILRLAYSGEYAQYAGLFFLVVLAGCILLTGMILGDAIIACQRFKSRLLAVVLGLIVNVLICWLFIGRYGLAAAVWAAVISSGVTTLTCAGVLVIAARSKVDQPSVST